jgi:hypothetical protein
MAKKRWSELSPRTQGLIIVAGVIEAGLKGAMLIDVKRRPAGQIRGSKRVWTLLAFANFLGPVAYFVIGRRGAPGKAFEQTRRS